MQDLGVIEPSISEWSSPIILVPKKYGSLRFCLDFRKLNSINKFDACPMLQVDEQLGRAKIFSTLDLCKGGKEGKNSPILEDVTTAPYVM
ncbi:hypothetical protein SKAU_G00353250 [Synaphobranchus kaupii]|uniref:Reverse transcriptase n=1 Tax=Synaphobranchus kaupii TaxID=118154 RepID=A0A9Q1EKX4_SYNKA|nr:hypothetical protein SKAU_G00353250 [Synaphobranchus kaupii]